ncbi:MAG: hypothetical protein ACOYOK_08925 [Pseudobdellovibrionaceae bacterium]
MSKNWILSILIGSFSFAGFLLYQKNPEQKKFIAKNSIAKPSSNIEKYIPPPLPPEIKKVKNSKPIAQKNDVSVEPAAAEPKPVIEPMPIATPVETPVPEPVHREIASPEPALSSAPPAPAPPIAPPAAVPQALPEVAISLPTVAPAPAPAPEPAPAPQPVLAPAPIQWPTINHVGLIQINPEQSINPEEFKIKKLEDQKTAVAAPIGPPSPTAEVQPARNYFSNPLLNLPQWDFVRHFWLWFGMGTSYQIHTNTLTTIEQKYSFNSMQLPSYQFSTGWAEEHWGLDLFYRDNPGLVKRTATIPVVDGQYRWKTMGAEAIYRPNGDQYFNFNIGLRMDTLPFTALDNSSGSVVLKDHSIQFLTLGIENRRPIAKRLISQYGLRYLHPISSDISGSTSYNLSPKYAFQGNIEAIHYLKDSIFLSSGLKVEWLDYDYSYADANVTSHQGHIRMIMSNIEIKLGYEF